MLLALSRILSWCRISSWDLASRSLRISKHTICILPLYQGRNIQVLRCVTEEQRPWRYIRTPRFLLSRDGDPEEQEITRLYMPPQIPKALLDDSEEANQGNHWIWTVLKRGFRSQRCTSPLPSPRVSSCSCRSMETRRHSAAELLSSLKTSCWPMSDPRGPQCLAPFRILFHAITGAVQCNKDRRPYRIGRLFPCPSAGTNQRRCYGICCRRYHHYHISACCQVQQILTWAWVCRYGRLASVDEKIQSEVTRRRSRLS